MISSLSHRWLLPLVKWGLRRMTLEAIATSHLVITAVLGNLSPLPNPTPMMHLPQVLPSSQFPFGSSPSHQDSFLSLIMNEEYVKFIFLICPKCATEI